jgi:hypothetical protein
LTPNLTLLRVAPAFVWAAFRDLRIGSQHLTNRTARISPKAGETNPPRRVSSSVGGQFQPPGSYPSGDAPDALCHRAIRHRPSAIRPLVTLKKFSKQSSFQNYAYFLGTFRPFQHLNSRNQVGLFHRPVIALALDLDHNHVFSSWRPIHLASCTCQSTIDNRQSGIVGGAAPQLTGIPIASVASTLGERLRHKSIFQLTHLPVFWNNVSYNYCSPSALPALSSDCGLEPRAMEL